VSGIAGWLGQADPDVGQSGVSRTVAAARARAVTGRAHALELIERAYLEQLLAGKLPELRPRHGAKTWLLVTLAAWPCGIVERDRAHSAWRSERGGRTG